RERGRLTRRHRLVRRLESDGRCCRPGNETNRAEEAVRGTEGVEPCAIDPGGEVEGVAVAARAAVAESDRPQTLKRHALAVGIREVAEELSGVRVVGVDLAVAETEVADEERPGRERAEAAGRYQGQAPGGVDAARHHPAQEIAVRIERIDDAVVLPVQGGAAA